MPHNFKGQERSMEKPITLPEPEKQFSKRFYSLLVIL